MLFNLRKSAGHSAAKKAIPIFCALFVILLFSSCGIKAPQTDQTDIVTPPIPAQTYSPPASEPSPNDEEPGGILIQETPAPMPMQAPEETMQTVGLLLDYLKENRQSDIQLLLTDGYDFDGDMALNSENYKTFISLSDFSIIGENFFGEYSSITVEASRPDTAQIQSDFYGLMTSEDTTYEGDINDYVTAMLNSDDCPATTYTSELTLRNINDEWKIVFDSELLGLISQTHANPFASNSPWADAISRDEIVAYIADNITVTTENGTCVVINNGNDAITSMSLKLEYTDENGTVKRTAYQPAFSSMNFAITGTYEMKPGYMWAKDKGSLFNDADKYGANLDKSTVSVFDVDFEDNIPFPSLSEEKQGFCDEFIAIDNFAIDKAQTTYYLSINGVTKLKISNNSEKTITRLSILVEFSDKDGVVRSAKPFRIIEPDETHAPPKIDPQSSWVLESERFFPLYHVPDLLIEQGNVNLTVIELDYD